MFSGNWGKYCADFHSCCLLSSLQFSFVSNHNAIVPFCTSWIHKTSDCFPVTFPRPAKICWASTTPTIKYISHFLPYRLPLPGRGQTVGASWKSIDIFYYYYSASSGYFSMLRKITGKQSRIYDVQKCTIAWWFETKENYNEENKQREWKSAQYFPQLPLKIRCLTTFQFTWNSDIT